MAPTVTLDLPEECVEFVDGLVRDGVYRGWSELLEESLTFTMLINSRELSHNQIAVAKAMEQRVISRVRIPKDLWVVGDELDQQFKDLLRYAEENGILDR